MSYLVLARKYRPQTFDELIGQDHVARTLQNAITIGRVAHAILFSGPRGTGKTTIARILAKAMNCEKGPTRLPCNACRSCGEITAGHAADVYEIDGASNNSVEQVRDLRENIKYMPAHGRYKIYIIDEVHMLSLAAFNALLKTLEEPPEHVIFLFATTERHKIPVTILSRCQQHDLRRIDMEAIIGQLRRIAEREGSEIDDESLTLIGREAGGSMRDALSLLDQVLACSEGAVSHDQVLDVLGVVDRKTVFEMSSALIKSDVPALLDLVDDAYRRGCELKSVYGDLVEHFRNLLVVKVAKTPGKLVDLPTHEIERMQAQAADVSVVFLNQIFDLLFEEEVTVKLSTQTRMAVEMVFLRLLRIRPALPIDTLVEKLERLKADFSEMPTTAAPPSAFHEDVPEKPPGPGRTEETGPAATGGAVSSEPAAAAPCVTGDDASCWKHFMEAVAEKQPSLLPSLSKGSLKRLTADRMVIRITGNDFTVNRIRKNMEGLREICRHLFGPRMEVDLESEKVSKKTPRKSGGSRAKKNALNHPLVIEALDVFDGKIVDVKIDPLSKNGADKT